jgi:hypothetical protein
MNPPVAPRRHRVWPWIVGLALTPVVVLALTINSAIRLNRDAQVLRQQIMAATGSDWHTQVQLSIPPVAVRLARAIVGCVHDVPPEAREALRAVRSGSVGVYRRVATSGAAQPVSFIAATDQAMARRGWARTVGVVDGGQTVLIYLPESRGSAQPSRICVAVCDGEQLVIVAAGFDAERLGRFINHQIGAHQMVRL